MRNMIWPLCIWLLASAVHAAPPPLRQIEELEDATLSVLNEHITTDLTIGWPWSSHSQILEHNAAVGPFQPSLPPPPQVIAQPAHSSTFTHSTLSPFRSFKSVLSGSKKDLAASEPVSVAFPHLSSEPPLSVEAGAASTNRVSDPGVPLDSIQPEPHLDSFFTERLRDTHFTGLLKLPSGIDYVPSPWFDVSYEDTVRRWSHAGKWRTAIKTEMSPNFLQGVLSERLPLLAEKATVYKIRFPAVAANHMEAGEVLIRMHESNVRWGADAIKDKTLSVWKTSGQGSRLAFLGLYHCPRDFFHRVILELPHTVRFQIVAGGTGSKFLLPEGGSMLLPRG